MELNVFNHKGDDVELAVDLFGMAELPYGGLCGPAEVSRHITGNARHIKNGVALKNLGQTVGKVAGQAFAGPLAQLKGQFGLLRFYPTADKPDVVSAFFRAAKERVKKFVCAAAGKNLVQKALIQVLHGHKHPLST